MTDRETARQKIAELVEHYRSLSESVKRGYSEEDVKKDFLLPLFDALGWDTANTQRRNEVRAEEKIAEGFPDYSFRLNGVPVFYLEAKKFSVNIGDEKPMKQAINYSYLKGVTWAVLSDFEGLMVFNADWEERDPIKARMLDLHWQNYAGSDFDDLWLLSREAIEAGEIDRTAERFGRKKKRDDVNKVLFADLTLWRHELFKEITQMGTTLWSRDYRMVDEAIQRFLDRLIFIRTVEDRRIEENRLRATLRQYEDRKRGSKNLFKDLLALFRELDGIYNAKLFAQHRLDTDLEIHDVNLLTTIINGLYDVKGGFANYDFAAIDADVLGAVYEQYLSFKAQDPQGKEALDLSKRSKRKAQGIYYTPKYVVRYIVQQTLGKLLDSPDMTAEKAHQLRILDPACGSGSFLIEAFQVLDRWLAQHGDETDRTDRRKRRMRILQENLYGVDLDPQAVEVAQLNLLLQAAHEREKLILLPHIQQGNSLISDPAVAGSDAFDWNERFPEVMAGQNRPLWFVTFVTHNSRVSERMVTYGIQTDEALVFSPEEQLQMAAYLAEAIRQYRVPVAAWTVLPDHVHMVIGAEDETALNDYVRKIKGSSSFAFKRRFGSESDKGLDVGTGKGLDVGTGKGLDEGSGKGLDVGTGKGLDVGTGKGLDVGSGKGLKPLVSQNTDPTPVWAQKFNRQPITDETALYTILQYVRENHTKHSERWGAELENLWTYGLPDKGLQPLAQIINAACVPVEQAARTPGGFDVVIGNPPYIPIETISESDKLYLQSKHPELERKYDSSVIFTLAGLQNLKSEGRLGFISSLTWQTGENFNRLRETIFKRHGVDTIVNLPFDVFPDAYVDTGIFVLTGKPSAGYWIHRFGKQVQNPDLQSIRYHYVSSDLISPPSYKVILEPVAHSILAYCSDNSKFITLGEITFSTQGLSSSRFQKKNVSLEDGWYPFLAQGQVYRFMLEISKLEYANLHEHANLKRFYESEPKLLIRRIISRSDRLMATFTDQKLVFTKDINPFVIVDPRQWNALYVLGIINSTLISYLYVNTSSIATKDDFRQTTLAELRQLPIRTINFDDPADKKRHDDMVALVERMLKLKADHAQAEAEVSDRRHDLAHQIAYLDKQIDALVYDLYGLTADEIAIVEGSAGG